MNKTEPKPYILYSNFKIHFSNKIKIRYRKPVNQYFQYSQDGKNKLLIIYTFTTDLKLNIIDIFDYNDVVCYGYDL